MGTRISAAVSFRAIRGHPSGPGDFPGMILANLLKQLLIIILEERLVDLIEKRIMR